MQLLNLDRIFDNDRTCEPGERDLTPDALPADWHLLWDERAAIVEFDGGFHREQAEAIALADILEQMKPTSN